MGRVVRVLLWLWPLWLWLGIRHAGVVLAAQSDHWRAAQAGGPLLLFVAVYGLLRLGLVPRGSAALAGIGAVVSGGLGFWQEYQRWEPYFASSGAVMGGVAHFDYPLLLVSLACVLLPFARWLPVRSNGAQPAQERPFGTARWMTIKDAVRRFGQGSLVLGEAYEPHRSPRLAGKAPLLRFDGSGHLLTVAGSGSGKTVSVAIPNALAWEHNLVVHDPKGEVYRATADARRVRGQDVAVLDSSLSESDSFNVLSWIDTSRDAAVEDVRAVASWLMPSAPAGAEARSGSDYFRQSAMNLLELLILHTLYEPELPDAKRSLRYVRTCLAGGMLEATLVRILSFGPDYAWGVAHDRAKALQRLVEDAPGQWTGVVGEAETATHWLTIPSLARLVAGEGGRCIRLNDLVEGRLDVYIGVPLKTLESTPQVTRVLLGALLNTVYERYQRVRRFDRRTLFLIDEMPRLRRMELLEVARDAGRGLGITLWNLVQDLGQLKAEYGEAGLTSWMENSQIRQFFGISDYASAEMLSRSLGQATVSYETSSENAGTSGWVLGTPTSGTSRSGAMTGRALLTPDEIMRLCADGSGAADEQIVLARGQPPLRCGLAKYYRRTDLGMPARVR